MCFLVLCAVCRELARHEAYHEVWACISDQSERAPMMHSRQPQDSVLPVNEPAPAVSGSCYLNYFLAGDFHRRRCRLPAPSRWTLHRTSQQGSRARRLRS